MDGGGFSSQLDLSDARPWEVVFIRSRKADGVDMVTPAVTYNPNAAVIYDPNGFPMQTFAPASPARNLDYIGQPPPYHDPFKPYPPPYIHSDPRAEQLTRKKELLARRLFSKDTTDYKLHGNKYGQWLSWGLIISIWLTGCSLGFHASVIIAREVWDIADRVRDVTKWFFMSPAVMLGLTVLYCCCGGKERKDGTREFTADDVRVL